MPRPGVARPPSAGRSTRIYCPSVSPLGHSSPGFELVHEVRRDLREGNPPLAPPFPLWLHAEPAKLALELGFGQHNHRRAAVRAGARPLTVRQLVEQRLLLDQVERLARAD